MPLRKAPPQLIEAFAAALPEDARIDRRKMFGFPAAFVNGNLFCGLHQENVIVRLSPELRDQLAKAGGLPWEPTPGRVMREYMVLPQDAAPQTLKRWLRLSFQFAFGLPPKKATGSRRSMT